MRIDDCGGYQTSFGPAVAYSNLWVNEWLGMYTDPVAKIGDHLPLALTRGVWAGGQVSAAAPFAVFFRRSSKQRLHSAME